MRWTARLPTPPAEAVGADEELGLQILFSGAIPGQDPFGIRALLGVLDTETGEIRHVFEYEPPDWLRGGQYIQFTGFRFDGTRFYLCLFNEILWFDAWPPREPAGRVTHPQLNDVHDCQPWRDGLLVANTGLETIDHLGLDGSLLRRWDLLEGEADARRIDPQLDYRLVPSTKPHRRHSNHVFLLSGEVWATQMITSEAICLTASAPRVTMDVGMPHDGLVGADGEVVFTTTNGHLVVVSGRDPTAKQIHDLAAMTPELAQLGWCRGVAPNPEQPGSYFVAFSKARRSKWREVGFWIRHGHDTPQSRICLYDTKRGALCQTWLAGPDPGYVLFQLEVLSDDRRIGSGSAAAPGGSSR
jgi:hypothetical protein